MRNLELTIKLFNILASDHQWEWRNTYKLYERRSNFALTNKSYFQVVNVCWATLTKFATITTTMITSLFYLYFRSSNQLHFKSFLSRVKMNSINWSAPNMWLFVAQLVEHCSAKGGEIRDTKTLNLLRNIVSLQVLADVSRFSPCLITLTRNKNVCSELKKCGALIGWFARARANLLHDKLWVWWKPSNKAKICCSK